MCSVHVDQLHDVHMYQALQDASVLYVSGCCERAAPTFIPQSMAVPLSFHRSLSCVNNGIAPTVDEAAAHSFEKKHTV